MPISIVSIASISPLGHSYAGLLEHYKSEKHCIQNKFISSGQALVSSLSAESELEIKEIIQNNKNYKNLDKSVLMALYASREAVDDAHWGKNEQFGINIGSSRGATELMERYHSQFITSAETSVYSSPTTTLGNISSWVAHDLKTQGPNISHSITCSTSLHSILNGIAWLNSGMCDKFLVGGSEAPLTPFTISQMQALNIYAKSLDTFPSKPLDLNKRTNTMILGEAAAIACLEKHPSINSIALITGIGYATEILEHSASLSSNAKCLERSMSMALTNFSQENIDVIITHTPGTIKGDNAELKAIKSVFKNNLPALTNNKWKIGHTLGASGIMSVEMAILMINQQQFFPIPYLHENAPKQIKNVMVNSVGFGGNAVSLIISSP